MFLSHVPVPPPWIHSRAWNRISCSTDLLHDIWLCCWLIEALNLEHYRMADVHPEVCETGWWQRPDCLLVSADHCQRWSLSWWNTNMKAKQMCPVDLSVFALFFSTGNWEQHWLHYHTDIKIWFCCSCKPLKKMSLNRPLMHPASLGRFLKSCFFNRSKTLSVFVHKQSPEIFQKCSFLVKTYD